MQRVKKNTDTFNRSVQTVKKQLDAEAKKQRQIRINNSPAMKAIKAVEQRTKAIRNAAVVVTAHAQRFSTQIKPAVNTLKWMTKAPFKVTVKAVDLASSGFRGLRSMLDMLKKPLLIGGVAAGAVGAAGIALIKQSLSGASMLERQMISMTHFLGVNNPKQGKSWAGQEAQRFIADLRKNADITPFDTDEVISTGTRALGIAGGKTKPAMSLLRLAEDMTALTPGKTLSDSIEALADLATGETERMKEFGFKISQAQIKASGGDWSKLKNGSGIGLTQMFRGGSEKLGQSAYGLWSTITGTMGSGVTNMGTRTLEYLKPELKRWANYLSGGGADKMFEAGSKMMASMFKGVVNTGKSITAYIQERFINNKKFRNLPDTESKVKFIFTELKTLFDGWYEKSGKAQLTDIGSKIGATLGVALAGSQPLIESAITAGRKIGQGMWEGIQGYIADNPTMTAVLGAVSGGIAGSSFGPYGAAIGALGGGVAAGQMANEANYNKSMSLADQLGSKQDGWITKNMGVSQKELERLKTVWSDEGYVKYERKLNQALSEKTGMSADELRKLSTGGNKDMQKYLELMNSAGFAYGIQRVPRNGFPAILHEGEQVLTAQEANQNRGSGGASQQFIFQFPGAVVREEADIARLAQEFRTIMEQVSLNGG